ncbi:MAG: 16S rRNA (adenine(1518)-N(6)/adenine(1519)-N(6))-dimethyltransferase RsmA [Actinomycetota bacterium]|nr:16S rRNA (adenine(1518)-N(6)/adenine(1519)-N(6))-dimethyltransferase RsmA [Actinomycetota bacterium]
MHSYISSPGNTVKILARYGIKLKKSLGQNFLIDTNNAKKIVERAGISPEDIVLEVGSGIGGLTEILTKKAKKVVCVEFDKLLVKAFRDIFKSELIDSLKLELIHADALKLDYRELALRYKTGMVVSNLPYSIGAVLLLKMIMEAETIEKMILTVQKDIAERLLASVGDKNYSSYTVKANFLADYKFCFQIPRNCFIPRPFVDSWVIEVKRKDNSSLLDDSFDRDGFFDFINACFLHRRKKLINSLSQKNSKYCDNVEFIIKLLTGIGKDRNIRAEELTLKDYIYLYRNL